MKQASVLVLDDEEIMRDFLEETLKRKLLQVDCASEPYSALKKLKDKFYDIVITDLKLPNMSGLDVLKSVKQISPQTEVILITAYGTVDTAVEAMKLGAFDYINKPFKPEEIEILVDNILLKPELSDKTDLVPAEVKQFKNIICKSKEMIDVLKLVNRVAESDTTILIQGESGTGKELVAKALHYHSFRKNKKFVTVNCAALPENLLESELFGHEKGSFTGAYQKKIGLFEVADEGTLFLDEIGEMSPALQIKLLRVLQEMILMPVGGIKEKKVDVRVITATNKNLEKEVDKNRFRRDLFYRLNVIPINIPPLRKRRDDIPELINHFIKLFNEKLKKNVKKINIDAERMLYNYDWPGNVRELENIIRRSVTLCQDDEIKPEDFLGHLAPQAGGYPFIRLPDSGLNITRVLKDIERDLIEQAIAKSGGNKAEAARKLGLKRTTLLQRIQKLKLLKK